MIMVLSLAACSFGLLACSYSYTWWSKGGKLLTNDQECFGFDPFKLTTSERRIFIDKMNCYLAYFQKMQEKAENRNVIDRVVKK